jgi:hypothetical protein
MTVIVIAITNLMENGIDNISVIRCIWGTRVSSRREITGIVTITILYRAGELKCIKCDDFIE